MKQFKMQTPIGPLFLLASETELRGVYFRQAPESMVSEPTGILLKAVAQLEEYFAGQRKTFDLPLAAKGTEFQMAVWDQLKKIPYAKTLSYADVARRVGKPKAFRAVGTANGANPLSIVVPCHRVIASNGALAGFGGGVKIKSALLELERAYG